MFRAVSRGAILAGTIVEAVAEYRRISGRSIIPLPERAEWLHRWCAICLRRLGVDYTYQGLPPRNGLLVSNHVSYLDILVLSAITPCIFVAKQEVASWPVFGRMARLSGTIFVSRERSLPPRRTQSGALRTSRRGDVYSVVAEISKAAESGTLVVLFPEGGSSDGRRVLPFYSPLLESAVQLELPVVPAYISYTLEDGDPAKDIAYWGKMTLTPHLMKMLSRHGIRPRVGFGVPRKFTDRKQAAMETHALVEALAGESPSESSPTE